MKLPNIIQAVLRGLFSPGKATYDQRHRETRILFWTVLGGILFAVAFGIALYYLNKSGRFER